MTRYTAKPVLVAVLLALLAAACGNGDVPEPAAGITEPSGDVPEPSGDVSEPQQGDVTPSDVRPTGQSDPAVVEEIEAGRTLWIESGIDDYSATMRVWTGSDSGDAACPADGYRIVVEGNSVIEAVNLDEGCRIESLALVTVDDMFDLAITASAAADEHGYELDPVWGFPRSFYGYEDNLDMGGFVDLFVPRATRSLIQDEIPGSIEEFRSQWRATGILDYSFVIERLCFCIPEVLGPFLVTVTDGAPESVTRVDGADIDPSLIAELPGTIDQLFDFIMSEVLESDLVVAGFDKDLGYPTDVYIDSIKDAADDELTLVVSDFESS